MPEHLKRPLICGLIGLAAALFIQIFTNIPGFFLTEMIDRYELQSYDARVRAKAADSEEASIDQVVIIDIEQNSINALGNFHEWPHAYHGRLLDVVGSGEPKALLFDMIFDPERRDDYYLVDSLVKDWAGENDELAGSAQQYLKEHDPDHFIKSNSISSVAHHALVFEPSDSINWLYVMDQVPSGYDPSGHTLDLPADVAGKLPSAERFGNTYMALLNNAHGAGAINFKHDMDGIIRRAPTAIYFKGPDLVFPSLTLSAIRDILGIPADGFEYDFNAGLLRLHDTTGTIVREIPIDEQGRMYVDYAGYYRTFYYIPYNYCFDPEGLDPAYWKDKVAIVGSSIAGLMDLLNTPVQESFPGVEIHANIIHSILQNEFVSLAGRGSSFMLLLVLVLLLGVLASLPERTLWGSLIMALIMAGWLVFAYGQFMEERVMWEVIRPITALGLTQLGVFLYTYLVADKDKRFLRATFSTYISPTLIEQMISTKQEPRLGGNEGDHTAFFSDIQSFSLLSEQLSATELVELLNRYLTSMTDILLENKGTLDKYVGDSIVAFFGAPVDVKDHEYWACRTAILMQDRLTQLRQEWESEGDRWPELVHSMQCRIGINTGPMVTGNMGTSSRMNYTMMGDTVNLASRLESSSKQNGVVIQISENTYEPVRDRVVVRDLDLVRVAGKTRPVRVYELIAETGKEPEIYKKILPAFDEALSLYRKQEWQQASKAFKETDNLEDMFPGRITNPSRVYIERCEFFQNDPPGDDWDGVWTLKSK